MEEDSDLIEFYGSPIINHPEVAILGIGKILERPVVRGTER